jgi:hypothetical protein
MGRPPVSADGRGTVIKIVSTVPADRANCNRVDIVS